MWCRVMGHDTWCRVTGHDMWCRVTGHDIQSTYVWGRDITSLRSLRSWNFRNSYYYQCKCNCTGDLIASWDAASLFIASSYCLLLIASYRIMLLHLIASWDATSRTKHTCVIISHIQMSYVTRMKKQSQPYELVMSHIWMVPQARGGDSGGMWHTTHKPGCWWSLFPLPWFSRLVAVVSCRSYF